MFVSMLGQMLATGKSDQVRRIVVHAVPVVVMDDDTSGQRAVPRFPYDDRPRTPPIRLRYLHPCPRRVAALAPDSNGPDGEFVGRYLAPRELGARRSPLALRDRWKSHVGLRAARYGAVVHSPEFARSAPEPTTTDRALTLDDGALGCHFHLDDGGVCGEAPRRAEHQPTGRSPDAIGLYVDLNIARTASGENVMDCTGTVAMVARALGRTGISLDLSADYTCLARWRIFESGHAAKTRERTNRAAQGALL